MHIKTKMGEIFMRAHECYEKCIARAAKLEKEEDPQGDDLCCQFQQYKEESEDDGWNKEAVDWCAAKVCVQHDQAEKGNSQSTKKGFGKSGSFAYGSEVAERSSQKDQKARQEDHDAVRSAPTEGCIS